jgi:dTDP-4-dehydrorhamnose reductase
VKKVLIVGSNGLLGSSLVRNFQNLFHVISGVNRIEAATPVTSSLVEIDVTNYANVETVIKNVRPQIIINCAGVTKIEECEKFPEKAFMVNAIGAYHLAKITSDLKVKFIQISTDHYASPNQIPRSEDEVLEPVNQYGLSKLYGEKYVMNFNPDAMIVRTNFFGLCSKKNTFLSAILEKLKCKETISGFTDVFFTPVGLTTLSQMLFELIQLDFSGLINTGSSQVISKYNFILLLRKVISLTDSPVLSIESKQIDGRTKRPTFLALDNHKFKEITQYNIPDIETMLNQELSITY